MFLAGDLWAVMGISNRPVDARQVPNGAKHESWGFPLVFVHFPACPRWLRFGIMHTCCNNPCEMGFFINQAESL